MTGCSLRRMAIVSVILAALAYVRPAVAGDQVPFKVTIMTRTTSTAPVDASHVLITVSISGKATHLGRFTGVGFFTLDLNDFSYVGSYTWTAANGDTIFGNFDGQLVPTATPGVFDNVETFTIEGGTGRFAGATGSGVAGGQADLNTGTSILPGEGTISTVGSNKK